MERTGIEPATSWLQIREKSASADCGFAMNTGEHFAEWGQVARCFPISAGSILHHTRYDRADFFHHLVSTLLALVIAFLVGERGWTRMVSD